MSKLIVLNQTYYFPSGSELQTIAQKYSHLPFKFGCKKGQCGVCAVRIIEGRQHLTSLSEQEKKTLLMKGYNDEWRLACQCAANGDISIEFNKF